VIVLTTFDLDEYVHAALRAFACRFLLRDAHLGLMLDNRWIEVALLPLLRRQEPLRNLRNLRKCRVLRLSGYPRRNLLLGLPITRRP